MTSTQRNILNLILFQVLWLACVLGGNIGAVISLSIYLFIYARFIGSPVRQWKALIAISLIGLAVDTLMAIAGIIDFNHGLERPLWLLCLWLGFATLFFHGLHWLRQLPLFLVAAIGALTGPLTYWGGASLSESDIPVSLTTFFLCYGIAWAVLLPLFTHMPRLVYARETL